MNVDPSHIMQVGMGFFASKTLLSAVELELFTVLGKQGMTAAQIGDRLALHPRGLHDFLDTLVALKLLDRRDDGTHRVYANTNETGVFLDKASPAYLGGIMEMANARLYPFWGHLTEALRTGQPQNELKAASGHAMFETLYADELRLEQFLRAMSGINLGNFMMLAEKVDFSNVKTVVDAGGANGSLAITLARRHAHLKCISFDLAPVVPVAKRHVEAMGCGERVAVVAGDFFKEPLPKADVVTMGNILHDWDEAGKRTLIQRAYDALPSGGRFITVENVIDDERRHNAFGLMMSLNMLIETEGGFDYTPAQFDRWCKDVGFARTEVIPLAGPTSAAIAYKP